MNNMKIFAIRDTKGDYFEKPFYQNTNGEAERSLKIEMDNPNSLISKFPEDYDLYCLGEYDKKTGVITPKVSPEHVLAARALAKKQPAANA